MAMKTKVVITGSTVRAGQLKDFFRMIDDGTIGFFELQNFIEDPKKFTDNGKRQSTFVRALNILGPERILKRSKIHELWEKKYEPYENYFEEEILYSDKTLHEAARQNKEGKASWYLIYIMGITLPEQRETLGINPESQPCFRSGYDWFLEEKESFWANKKPKRAHYLINFQDFGTQGLSYDEQLKKVEELGPEYDVLDPHMFAEAIISLKKHTNQEFAGFWTHRSSVLNSKNEYVCIGDFSSVPEGHFGTGLKIESNTSDYKYSSCRMVVYKKHDR